MIELARGIAAISPLVIFCLVSWHFPIVGIIWLGALLVYGLGVLVSETE